MRESIIAHLRNLQPMESIGKWGLARLIDPNFDGWGHSQNDDFLKTLLSVIKELKREGLAFRMGGGWVHRD